MATLIAKIDSFDDRWGELEKVMEGTPREVHDWLVAYCSCPREEVNMDDIYDDVILQDPEWVVTYRDLMCDTCYLYEL